MIGVGDLAARSYMIDDLQVAHDRYDETQKRFYIGRRFKRYMQMTTSATPLPSPPRRGEGAGQFE